ncbi:hypothetical protein P8C59_002906 [Phyllachora maydis]|uniref:Uncharacterized protein n=1 Tax=Phyllachora maydis TaxID=1825666 RepID=A0AAD9I0S0_9PEZI|nr:hypothetical protein P8C59_002906 [Phyllachora maydis]
MGPIRAGLADPIAMVMDSYAYVFAKILLFARMVACVYTTMYCLLTCMVGAGLGLIPAGILLASMPTSSSRWWVQYPRRLAILYVAAVCLPLVCLVHGWDCAMGMVDDSFRDGGRVNSLSSAVRQLRAKYKQQEVAFAKLQRQGNSIASQRQGYLQRLADPWRFGSYDPQYPDPPSGCNALVEEWREPNLLFKLWSMTDLKTIWLEGQVRDLNAVLYYNERRLESYRESLVAAEEDLSRVSHQANLEDPVVQARMEAELLESRRVWESKARRGHDRARNRPTRQALAVPPLDCPDVPAPASAPVVDLVFPAGYG